MLPNADSTTFSKICKARSLVFRASDVKRVAFLDASLKAENHFKAYKSGQRNIKNFSENYKY